jgi:hypothetical protein
MIAMCVPVANISSCMHACTQQAAARSADGGAAEIVLAEQLTAMLLTLVQQQQQQPVKSNATTASSSSMQQWHTALTALHPRLLQLCTQQQWGVSPQLLTTRLELLLALLHLQQQQQTSIDDAQQLAKLMAVAVSYCDALSAVAAVRLSGLLACELLLQHCAVISSSSSSSGSSSAVRRNRLKPLSDSPEPLRQGVHAAAALAFAALSRRLADADAGVSTRAADVMAALLPLVRSDTTNTSSSSGAPQSPQKAVVADATASSESSAGVTVAAAGSVVVPSDALIPQWQFSYEGLLGVCLAHLAVAASESEFADQLDAVLRAAAVLDTAVFTAAVSAKRTELGSSAQAGVQQALSDLEEHAELLLSFQSRK